ncbi:MAG: hypothetical protein P8M50_01300 [Paracoccaceae bacterium]|nr:hypothetical protein [Paracoccaceae bacterium]
MNTDDSGRYSAMYKPFHLIGLELNISILSAALIQQPTGVTRAFTSDVIAVSKSYLKAGRILDGEGGFSVWGKLCPAKISLQFGYLPIGLANNVKLKKDIQPNTPLKWSDINIEKSSKATELRLKMETKWAKNLLSI